MFIVLSVFCLICFFGVLSVANKCTELQKHINRTNGVLIEMLMDYQDEKGDSLRQRLLNPESGWDFLDEITCYEITDKDGKKFN